VRVALTDLDAVFDAGPHNRKYWSLPGGEALGKDE
jgi:hypothetical protein